MRKPHTRVTPPEGEEIDRLARRLIRAAEPGIREHLGLTRLDVDLVGDLYVRIRNILIRNRTEQASPMDDLSGLVDEIALTIFMTSVADDAGAKAEPELLVELRRSLETVLKKSNRAART
jgi:hypothetical protein